MAPALYGGAAAMREAAAINPKVNEEDLKAIAAMGDAWDALGTSIKVAAANAFSYFSKIRTETANSQGGEAASMASIGGGFGGGFGALTNVDFSKTGQPVNEGAAAFEAESLAILPGVDGYISPSLYATKAETGEVVPTWNYEVVVAYGRLDIHDDPVWLRRQVGELTAHHEARQQHPWSVGDAPESFVDRQLRAIVGVELVITRWEGKAKMSQNQPEANRRSVVAGLAASPDSTDQQLLRRIIAHGAECPQPRPSTGRSRTGLTGRKPGS
jgi:predicted FMN-binding regulatory protein PaiB